MTTWTWNWPLHFTCTKIWSGCFLSNNFLFSSMRASSFFRLCFDWNKNTKCVMNMFYSMASSLNGQDEPYPAVSLATWWWQDGAILPAQDCLLCPTRQLLISQMLHNESFTGRPCLVKMLDIGLIFSCIFPIRTQKKNLTNSYPSWPWLVNNLYIN